MEIFLVIVVVAVGLLVWASAVASRQEAEAKARREEDEERKAAEQQLKERKIGEYAQESQSDGWDYISQGKLMHIPGQPPCFMMMSVKNRKLRFDRYSYDDSLVIEDVFEIFTRDILSITVARPKTKETRKEMVPVSIVESKNKSPIGRGLVGGALLGPAGLVLGAASGLNAKTSTRIEHETVYREYEGLGAPQLIIGTNVMERPVLKVRCETQELADDWLYRIRALQS
jgi:hypothetical protein